MPNIGHRNAHVSNRKKKCKKAKERNYNVNLLRKTLTSFKPSHALSWGQGCLLVRKKRTMLAVQLKREVRQSILGFHAGEFRIKGV